MSDFYWLRWRVSLVFVAIALLLLMAGMSRDQLAEFAPLLLLLVVFVVIAGGVYLRVRRSAEPNNRAARRRRLRERRRNAWILRCAQDDSNSV